LKLASAEADKRYSGFIKKNERMKNIMRKYRAYYWSKNQIED